MPTVAATLPGAPAQQRQKLRLTGAGPLARTCFRPAVAPAGRRRIPVQPGALTHPANALVKKVAVLVWLTTRALLCRATTLAHADQAEMDVLTKIRK